MQSPTLEGHRGGSVIFLLALGHTRLVVRYTLDFSTSTGTSRKNVEPAPGSDSTQIRPPCMAMIRWAIDRPSPVPPFVLVDELSACWNSSKILTRWAGSMPGPVSRTESV